MPDHALSRGRVRRLGLAVPTHGPQHLAPDVVQHRRIGVQRKGLIDRRQRFDTRLVELDLGAVADAGAVLGGLMLEFESFLVGQAVRDDVTAIVLSCPERAAPSAGRPSLSRS